MSPVKFGAVREFIGITFDASALLERIEEFEGDVVDAMDKALGAVALQLLNDALNEVPKTPVLTGRLAGSGAVHVQGKRITDNRSAHPAGTPLPSGAFKPSADKNIRTAHVSFSTPYASYVHEHPELHFRDPGSGSYFLTSKLDAHAAEYQELLKEELLRRLKR